MSSGASQPAGGPPQMSGPPYLPNQAQLGGRPTVDVDVPISAVLLAIFIGLAVVHMTILQRNNKRNHKFLFSGMLFGLSMARTSALTMRIVWACRPTNVQIAIAANILTQAGVIILFIANLFFAQRILRAYHPSFGWHNTTRYVFRFLVASVLACLIMVITCTVHSFYTLDLNARRMDRDVQLFAGTFFALLAFIPAPVVLIASLTPRRDSRPVEKFGQGRFRSKVALLLFTSLLLTLGAGFRIGVNFDLRPANAPAWFHHKAAYYTLNFGIEIIVSALYAAVRFDRRFHVPNGAKGPGDYRQGGLHIATEEEAFGPDASVDTIRATPSQEEWERQAKKEVGSDDSGLMTNPTTKEGGRVTNADMV
ncbi:hypothetical protein PG999_010558 [Apiospora kogelbergensis]|uniref:DUF5671 domain-containing protein n=1 Tax=Apiospora kogelbergensis TaxID=1337665 RepID=A0AAW0QKD5_9PEZI